MTEGRIESLDRVGTRRWMVALVGPPGSGKGTQSAWLTSALEVTALSTGELARHAAREATDRGRLVRQYVNTGALLPDAVAQYRRRAESLCA